MVDEEEEGRSISIFDKSDRRSTLCFALEQASSTKEANVTIWHVYDVCTEQVVYKGDDTYR